MSYLAMSAAPIDNDNNVYGDNYINKKRNSNSSHTKTQKFRQQSSNIDQNKVNSVLQSIHNNNSNDDDELGNYNPKGSSVSAKHSDNFKPLNPFDFPDNPISMGGERTKTIEGMSNVNENTPQPIDNDTMELQELQSAFMNDAQVRDYYRKLMPTHNNNSTMPKNNKHSNNYTSNSSSVNFNDTNQVLFDKLNYVINLLEEQQDQKTNNVAEEVVLYSFLGIFIIFIVDGFTKVGKYVR
jgi:hypothetical protein